MKHTLEFEQEEDGRWIAEIQVLPGAMAYGTWRAEVASNAEAIARQVIDDRS